MNAIQVLVGSCMDEMKRLAVDTKVNEELKNLQPSDPFFPPDANPARALKVVPVHEDVDGEVEGDGDPRDGALAVELRVAEEGCSAVVVAMEECWESMNKSSSMR